jgi:branched-chain amino acid transport system ATP-binding protein
VVGLIVPLLIRDVTLRFRGIIALDAVSFAARDRELLAIVGPNGAGKTALLNCISGVYRPNSGAIVFDGLELNSIPIHRIAQAGIGRSFQHAELFPHLTVTENLLVGRHLRMRTGIFRAGAYFGRAASEEASERRAVERIIDFFELYRYRDVVAANLSFGVQKLVGVARALALDPKLLLLDEPSTGLMREEKENFARYLLRMRHELGLAILWVEHDMQMVADLADRVVVLNYGEVIAEGSPEAICRDPRVAEAYLGADATAGAPSETSPLTIK